MRFRTFCKRFFQFFNNFHGHRPHKQALEFLAIDRQQEQDYTHRAESCCFAGFYAPYSLNSSAAGATQ